MNEKYSQLENAVDKSFDADDRELAFRKLKSITLRHVMANSQTNLDLTWAAILQLCERDINKLDQLVNIAKLDFRDIIYMASQPPQKN